MNNVFDELFPQDYKDELAKEYLKIGSVFKVFDEVAKKEKLLILVGFKYDKSLIAFVRINTEINRNVFPTEALKSEHLELEYNIDLRPFLTHKSYVDCTNFQKRNFGNFHRIIQQSPINHKGNLSDEDLKLLLTKIAESKVITIAEKKEFGLYFTPSSSK